MNMKLTHNQTDLYIEVIKIQYRTEGYVKFKGRLINKRNGIVYEQRTYKMPIDKWNNLKEIKC